MDATEPPYQSLKEARARGGDNGVRELLAWYVEQPAYIVAARRLETKPAAMRRAAKRVGFALPDRSAMRGAPAGSEADVKSRAARGLPPRA